VLSKKEMNKIIQTCHDPKKICKALIKKAKNKQSTDNISCLMITSSKKVNVE
jgi:serine/threonine protein phosphatase PrpC